MTNNKELIELGLKYITGKGGVEKDVEKGLEYLETAKKKGSQRACYHLGKYYIVHKDYEQALGYFEDGKDIKSRLCTRELAEMYRYGLGIPKNLENAINLYKKSAEFGCTDSLIYAASLIQDLPESSKIKKSEALELLNKAVEANDKHSPIANRELGKI